MITNKKQFPYFRKKNQKKIGYLTDINTSILQYQYKLKSHHTQPKHISLIIINYHQFRQISRSISPLRKIFSRVYIFFGIKHRKKNNCLFVYTNFSMLHLQGTLDLRISEMLKLHWEENIQLNISIFINRFEVLKKFYSINITRNNVINTTKIFLLPSKLIKNY